MLTNATHEKILKGFRIKRENAEKFKGICMILHRKEGDVIDQLIESFINIHRNDKHRVPSRIRMNAYFNKILGGDDKNNEPPKQ